MSSTTVVVITRNRRASLVRTLEHLDALPEQRPVLVVDNASTDGTVDAVHRASPRSRVVSLGENIAARARATGVRTARTPYVAFCDDDSWWAPGALACAERQLDAHPHLALIAARIIVEPGGRLDPTCRLMQDSPLGSSRPLPGPRVLGFLACGAVARRDPLLGVGAFDHLEGTGAEERLIALDLAAAGWDLAYVPEVTAHHHPPHDYDDRDRSRQTTRNDLWTAWLRRPVRVAMAATVRARDRGAVRDTVRRLPFLLRARRRVPEDVEAALHQLDAQE